MQMRTALHRHAVRRRTFIALAAALCLPPGAAQAQADFPNRPVRIIVPYAAGGSSDFLGRLLAAELPKALGQPVFVENRPGASGNVGTVMVSRAQPDGYTLLLNTSSFITNASLFKPAPYDPIGEFAPIADLAASPTAIAANLNAGLNSVRDMVDQARADPQKLNYGTGGPGSMPHLAMELLKLRTGVNITHVPFGGGGPAMQATITGTIQLTAGNLANMIGQLQSGLLKGLAITAAQRWPELPDIPTMAEAGYSGFVMEGTHLLVAPAATPGPVVDRLAREVLAILRRPDIDAKIRQAGFYVVGGGPAELKARFDREVPEFRDLIARVGIPPR
ncbi:MAG: tripartite tricarboxylate transporter substrate binding protein [Variibacter sp.]|nr:tripartite tricarboxylate transporter substrate binding protein [Variibacter sp.]